MVTWVTCVTCTYYYIALLRGNYIQIWASEADLIRSDPHGSNLRAGLMWSRAAPGKPSPCIFRTASGSCSYPVRSIVWSRRCWACPRVRSPSKWPGVYPSVRKDSDWVYWLPYLRNTSMERQRPICIHQRPFQEVRSASSCRCDQRLRKATWTCVDGGTI